MHKRLKRFTNPYKARPLPPKILIGLVATVGIALLVWLGYGLVTKDPVVNNFQSCIAAGNPVLESYPEQCVHEGQSYINPAQNVPHPFQ